MPRLSIRAHYQHLKNAAERPRPRRRWNAASDGGLGTARHDRDVLTIDRDPAPLESRSGALKPKWSNHEMASLACLHSCIRFQLPLAMDVPVRDKALPFRMD